MSSLILPPYMITRPRWRLPDWLSLHRGPNGHLGRSLPGPNNEGGHLTRCDVGFEPPPVFDCEESVFVITLSGFDGGGGLCPCINIGFGLSVEPVSATGFDGDYTLSAAALPPPPPTASCLKIFETETGFDYTDHFHFEEDCAGSRNIRFQESVLISVFFDDATQKIVKVMLKETILNFEYFLNESDNILGDVIQNELPCDFSIQKFGIGPTVEVNLA